MEYTCYFFFIYFFLRNKSRMSAEDEEGMQIAGDLVAPHAALLRCKAKFHRHFAAFQNNYACDARLNEVDEDDIGMNDPVSTMSLQALLAVVARARAVLESCSKSLPAANDGEADSALAKRSWLELVAFVGKLSLHEADLAYRSAVFVAATLAEEGRFTASDFEKFAVEHEGLRACFDDASQRMFLRQEFAIERPASAGSDSGETLNPSQALVRLLSPSAPNFFNSNKEEILSANAKTKPHALHPIFNLMDAIDGPAEELEPKPQLVVDGPTVPPLIEFDPPWEKPNVGWVLPQNRPGHERTHSDFDLDMFTTPLQFTPLQSGPASDATYVDPFTSPPVQEVPQSPMFLDMFDVAQSFARETVPLDASPQSSAAAKPPLGAQFEEIEIEDLDFGRQIGRGAFGEVFRGRYQGTDVAIKRLCVLDNVKDERGLAEFKRELNFLTRLRHRHIVQFIGACTTLPNLCIVMDYCDKGSLYGYLHNPQKFVTPFKVLKWMSECAKGLVFLHSRNIIHRDIKSGNLLIDEGGSIKLGDFGLSRLHSSVSTGGMMSLVGTYPFMAPELLDGSPKYSAAVDVYSFGIVMWECLTRREPFAGMSPMQIVAALIRGERPHYDPTPGANSDYISLPSEYHELMRKCWGASPYARPSMTDVLDPLERMFQDEKRNIVAAKHLNTPPTLI